MISALSSCIFAQAAWRGWAARQLHVAELKFDLLPNPQCLKVGHVLPPARPAVSKARSSLTSRPTLNV
eukprot:1155830-Pelagomonas_calceolata.AAC.1